MRILWDTPAAVISAIAGTALALVLSFPSKILSIPISLGYYLVLSKRFPKLSVNGSSIRVGNLFAAPILVESPSRLSRDSISIFTSSIRSLLGGSLRGTLALSFNFGEYCTSLMLILSDRQVDPSIVLPAARMRIGRVSIPGGDVLKSLLPCSFEREIIPPKGAEVGLVESVLAILPSGWVLCVSERDGKASAVIGTNSENINVPAGFRVRGCREIPGDALESPHIFDGAEALTAALGLALTEGESVRVLEMIEGDWRERAVGMMLSVPGSVEGKPVYVRGEEVVPDVIGRDFIGIVAGRGSDNREYESRGEGDVRREVEEITERLPPCVEYAALSGRSRVIVVCDARVKGMLREVVGERAGAVVRVYGSNELDKLREMLETIKT